MAYETILGMCQLAATTIFGSVFLGILIHALRPSNRSRFDAAARLALDDETDAGDTRRGR